MIDKTVLKQMGFTCAIRSCDNSDDKHTVWYHDSGAWVHFGCSQKFEICDERNIKYVVFSGDLCEMDFFFEKFLENFENRLYGEVGYY